jgi:hypothetical protein
MAVLKRISPLVPALLFAAYPLLSLFEQNQTELPLSVIWSPLWVTLAITALVFGAVSVVLKRPAKAGVLTALAVVMFFYWETFKSDLSGLHFSDDWLFALWLVLFVASVVLVVRTRHSLWTLALGLGLMSGVLAVVPAVRIATYQSDHPAIGSGDTRLWQTVLPPPHPPGSAPRPDIYVIIPDDYARSDVLRQYFHYDNSAFVRQLQQRGFAVSQQARSPYSDSESNIAAELNMDYLTGLPGILGRKSQDVRPVKTLIEDNRASRLLKPLGYSYVHIDSDEVTFAGGNPDISSVATPDSFPSLWLQKSVLRLIGGSVGFNDPAGYERYRKAVRSAFSRLGSVPGGRSPKFVVFHTLVPHDPYVFGLRGQAVSFPHPSDTTLHGELGMKYYLAQLRYLEKRLLQTVDAIKARSKRPPVLVIQSDEGFEADPETVGGDAAMQQIRVKGLAAVSIPGARGPSAPAPPTTVNTLRYVFNQTFGTRYPLLRAASYPEGDYPYQWEKMRVR